MGCCTERSSPTKGMQDAKQEVDLASKLDKTKSENKDGESNIETMNTQADTKRTDEEESQKTKKKDKKSKKLE